MPKEPPSDSPFFSDGDPVVLRVTFTIGEIEVGQYTGGPFKINPQIEVVYTVNGQIKIRPPWNLLEGIEGAGKQQVEFEMEGMEEANLRFAMMDVVRENEEFLREARAEHARLS